MSSFNSLPRDWLDKSELSDFIMAQLQEELDECYTPPTPHWLNKPAIFILGVDGHGGAIERLYEQMDERVPLTHPLDDLVQQLQYKDRAMESLDYHCLGFLEEHAYGHLYHHFEPMVEYLRYVGQELYRGFLEHSAYADNFLPYRLCKIRTSGMYFQRKDLFEREVLKEQTHERLRSPLALPDSFAQRLSAPLHRPTF